MYYTNLYRDLYLRGHITLLYHYYYLQIAEYYVPLDRAKHLPNMNTLPPEILGGWL